jgi:transcriptional regulator with XRE-family HTH domain
MNTAAAIESLVRRGYTLASLERALHLSPNYLSKVRHEAVRPSFQLAALLTLIAKDPEPVLTALATVKEPPRQPRPQPSTTASGAAAGDDAKRINVIERVAAVL